MLENCFDILKKDYERAGYEVIGNDTKINIEYGDETLKAVIEKDLTLRKEDDDGYLLTTYCNR